MKNNCLSKLWIGLMMALLLPVAVCAENYTYDTAGRLTSATYADGSSITYTYDVNGNILNKTVAVPGSVADTTKPVIILLGTSPVTIARGSVYTDAGATASDNVDGNITANIVMVNPVNTAVIGTYTTTYNVSDVAGNAATQVTRTVNVTDQTAPVITLNGTTPVIVAEGSVYADAGATAADQVDGVVAVVKTGAVNAATAGVYILTYTATDAAGNSATASRKVKVTAPGTTANGSTAQITGTTTVDIVSANEIISNFSATGTAGTTPPSGVSFPFGIVSYTTSVTPGGSQTVTMSFSTALPANTVLYEVNNAGVYSLIPKGTGVNQWMQVNANTVALTLLDGDLFDLDATVNGVIVDSVAVGSGTVSSPASSGGGGCVIVANPTAPIDPLMPILVLLPVFWLLIKRKPSSSVQYRS